MNSLKYIAIALSNAGKAHLLDTHMAWMHGIILGFDTNTLEVLKKRHAWSDQTIHLLEELHKDYTERRKLDET